jgi:RNA polymerase sigma-70 factor (ECF subfamily)
MEKVRSETERIRFERMYVEHHRDVLAYCARRVHDSEAWDVCAETFLVAWRKLDDVPESSLPFLYQIARRVLSNHRRSRNRRDNLEKRLLGLGVAPGEDLSVVVAVRDQDRRIRQAVRRLGPVDREIIMLDAWEEMPRQAIADITGLSRDAIDHRIHRAYRRLERILRPRLSITTSSSPPVTEKGGA